MNILSESLIAIVNNLLVFISGFLPKLAAGFLLLFIGLIVASLFKDLLKIVFKYFKIEKWLQSAGFIKTTEPEVWPSILGELVRWAIIFIFLASAIEVWGIPKVGDVLQQLLLFLPNVFVVVIIGWVGLVVGRLAGDIVRHGVRGLGGHEAIILGNVARYVIIFFTILIVLTQLGVATELIKILFTGIVGMLTLSLGLAFGLGGQDEAKDLLKKLRQRLEEKKITKNK